MNANENMTSECNSTASEPVLWVQLFQSCCVGVFGSLGDIIALWCVATCTKTRRPVKVLVFNVFLPTLVMCLAAGLSFGYRVAHYNECNQDFAPSSYGTIVSVMTTILLLQELNAIAVLAVVRAAAIWAPHKPKIGIRGAVVLVVMTYGYPILGLMGLAIEELGSSIVIFSTITLPSLITAASYILMIFVIQRNKRRLDAYQQQESVTTTMDRATRAMLAVFISNLVFILPYSISLLKSSSSLNEWVIIYFMYRTHFAVDPLLYICFNSDYRKKVLSSVTKVIQSTSCITVSARQTEPAAQCDQQNRQKSFPHMQEESNL